MRTPSSLSRRELLLLAVLLLTAAPLAAQETPAADAEGIGDGLFVESLDVNVVNVEVYVTDKQGNRVDGLTRDDFELRVDGRPHAISNFYAVDSAADTAALAATQRTAIPGTQVTPPVPEDQRLHLVVYVDNFNIKPFNRNRVLGHARTFVRQRLRPGDQVMLVTYDRTLHVREEFTDQPERVASALYDLEELSGFAVHYESDRRDILEAVEESNSPYEVMGRVRQYAGSLFNDHSFSLDALKETVDKLAGLPGRKAILYVSDGIAMRPAEDVFHAVHQKWSDTSVLSESFEFDLGRRVQEIAASANANRVTFYTLDAAGLRTFTYLDAASRSPQGGALVDQVHFSNLQSPLLQLAESTGGQAGINTNGFDKVFDRFAEDLDHYYSLGFTPVGATGRYHRIEVDVKRKGLVVRHRDGFRDKSTPMRMADSTLATLYFGYESNDLGVRLDIGQGTLQSDSEHFLVPVMVRIPIDSIDFLPHGDLRRGRLRLFLVAMDAEGGLSPVQDVPIPIELSAEELAAASGKFYPYEVRLLMRRGRQAVAIGLRDEIGAANAFLARDVEVGT